MNRCFDEEVTAMRSLLRSKPRLWCVLALTVGAAVAIVAGISNQAAKFPTVEMSTTDK